MSELYNKLKSEAVRYHKDGVRNHTGDLLDQAAVTIAALTKERDDIKFLLNHANTSTKLIIEERNKVVSQRDQALAKVVALEEQREYLWAENEQALAKVERLREVMDLHPESDWDEDLGPVLWLHLHKDDIIIDTYFGCPLDSGWWATKDWEHKFYIDLPHGPIQKVVDQLKEARDGE